MKWNTVHLPYPPSSFPGFSPTRRSSADSLMCQIFFLFDWQTGDNIIFNRPIIGLTPTQGTQLGPRTRISCLFGAEAEVLVSSAFCVPVWLYTRSPCIHIFCEFRTLPILSYILWCKPEGVLNQYLGVGEPLKVWNSDPKAHRLERNYKIPVSDREVKTHTLYSGTSPYRPYKIMGVPPSPRPRE